MKRFVKWLFEPMNEFWVNFLVALILISGFISFVILAIESL
jgi:hypothetical protein